MSASNNLLAIASTVLFMPRTPGRPINDVVAENLSYWMGKAGVLTQQALAKRSGVSQRTISNYLHPNLRADTSSGKEPSAKLSELSKLADALGVEVHQLVREITEQERAFYARIEAAYRDLTTRRHGDDPEESGLGQL